MVALYCGQAVGQLLLGASGNLPAVPFQLASMLISLSIIPLCLTRTSAPPPAEATAFGIGTLFAASPLGTVGAVTTGLMLGAFYGLAAVQVRRLGLDLSRTANFMMIVILGGVVLQWPLGRISDLYDRRKVIVLSFAATLCVSLAMSLLAPAEPWLLVLGAMFGGHIDRLGGPFADKEKQERRAEPRHRLGDSHGIEHVASRARAEVAPFYPLPLGEFKR